MTKRDYSKHQEKIINRYYEHFDTIMLQKLQELVSELFLALNTPKEDKLWERVEKAMVNLKVPAQIREHIMVKRSIEVLARNLEDWTRKK